MRPTTPCLRHGAIICPCLSPHQQQAAVLHEPVREVMPLHPDSEDVSLYDEYDLATVTNCSNPPPDGKLHEGGPDTAETRRAL